MGDVLLHFVAAWADRQCGPHKREVAKAARKLGLTVRVLEIDDHDQEAREYTIMNVPAVVIEGIPESRVYGALPAKQLAERLAPFVTRHPHPTV